MLPAILQFIGDSEDPYGLVSQLVAALPSGSYLVLAHPTDDFNPNRQGESIQRYNERVADQATLRGHDETARPAHVPRGVRVPVRLHAAGGRPAVQRAATRAAEAATGRGAR